VSSDRWPEIAYAAGLVQYVEQDPPHDDQLSSPVESLSRLNEAFETVYGPEAEDMIRSWGRRATERWLSDGRHGMGGPRRLIPGRQRKLAGVVKAFAEAMDNVRGEHTHAWLQVDEHQFWLVNFSNMFALGRIKTVKSCHIWVATIEAILRWAGLACYLEAAGWDRLVDDLLVGRRACRRFDTGLEADRDLLEGRSAAALRAERGARGADAGAGADPDSDPGRDTPAGAIRIALDTSGAGDPATHSEAVAVIDGPRFAGVANLVTGSRIVLAVPAYFFGLTAAGLPWLALVVAVAGLTDLVDGGRVEPTLRTAHQHPHPPAAPATSPQGGEVNWH